MQRRSATANRGPPAAPAPPPSSPKHTNTITYEELPEWAKDNHFVVRGYRRISYSYASCVKSIFAYTHNETVNIWTHLIGSTVAVLTLIYCAVAIQGEGRSNATRVGWAAAVTVIQPFPSASQPSVTMMDSLGFIVFFLSAATCLGFSATFHTLHSHSMHVSHYWNRLDYVGIVVLISGTFWPLIHLGFFCDKHLRNLYLTLVYIASAGVISVVISPKSRTPAYRRTRTWLFIALGTSAVFPVAHAIVRYGLEEAKKVLGLFWLALGGLLYIVGALLYAERCPERLLPGRFDFWGSSHQIFHVAILLAALSHYMAMSEAFRYVHGELLGVC